MSQGRPGGFSILPLVVKNLLIINAIFFLAEVVMEHVYHFSLTDRLGLHYPTSEKFKIYQFISYLFMHGDFFHLLFNMLALWMFGNMLENYWGPKKFLQFFLFCGIGAAITHYTIFYFDSRPLLSHIDQYIHNPSATEFTFLLGQAPVTSVEMANHLQPILDQYNNLNSSGDTQMALQSSVEYMMQYRIDYLNAPNVIGASGAIYGILLAYGMTFPNTIIYVNLFIPMKAKYFVLIYGLIELFSGIRNSPSDNVAHFAHLGGMIFGLILILIWKNRAKRNFYS